MKNLLLSLGPMLFLALVMNACATFEKPATSHEAQVHERALTKENNGIRVSASVLGDEEATQIFGIDLALRKIQAVWIVVENNTDSSLILLPTAIDPEYFSPLEVAFIYSKGLNDDANASLEEHLLDLNFPIRSPVNPGSGASGYIFTNWIKGMKVIDVDLIGDDFSQNFTFFALNPDSSQEQDIIARLETRFSSGPQQNVEDEGDFRQALEQLPCCVLDEKNGVPSEPLNIVIIGASDDWMTAFARRGYRYQALTPRYVFGRAQDLSGHKLSRGYIKPQAHNIRLWRTPLLYKGKPVWIGQTSVRYGGRFANKTSAEVTRPLDPHVDEARYSIAQDLAYSQSLIKIGFVKGSGQIKSVDTGEVPKEAHYSTDGLRAVLVFTQRPSSLDDIDFFDWEKLGDQR